MGKSVLFCAAAVSILLMNSCNLFAADGDMGGLTQNGSADCPYLIEDYNDFQLFCDDPNYWSGGVHTRLDCNLNLDSNLPGRKIYTTAIIAYDTDNTNDEFDGIPFTGVFDGNNHTISNIVINTEGENNCFLGLFGQIEDANSSIINLGLENLNINSSNNGSFVGGICGSNGNSNDGLRNGGSITGCYSTGSITCGDLSWYVGGLCGFNDKGIISNCYSNSSIICGVYSESLGGLCGENFNGNIVNCYATGTVLGNESWAIGGLCGKLLNGSISNCYATGSVVATGDSDAVGGLCGRFSGVITSCYAIGAVSGGDNSRLGGLYGFNDEGTVIDCYSYLFSGPGDMCTTALDELQMNDVNSFNGFDFAGDSNDGDADCWMIADGHCPKLSWQNDDGPILVPNPPKTTLLGSGHCDDPFQINNYADFMELVSNSKLNRGYYVLTADIDLSAETFDNPVINRYFGGYFNGNGHIISNMTIDTAGADTDYLGLFSMVSASIGSLGIENANIIGGEDSDNLGGLCGNNYGIITNCHSSGSVSGNTYLGGLCGINFSGTITNCYSTCTVNGGGDHPWFLGGLCGDNWFGDISNSFASGDVNSSNGYLYFGGLCGMNTEGTISNCYSTGNVNGEDCLGGLCGRNSGIIIDCYSTGSVTGDDYLGGLCGYNFNGTITASFWDTQTSERITSAGGIGRTTDQMQKLSTFTNALWDFVGETTNGSNDTWRMCVDDVDYPRLWWEFTAGDIVCSDGVDFMDFAVLAANWLSDDSFEDWYDNADLDFNGQINVTDLMLLSENWLYAL